MDGAGRVEGGRRRDLREQAPVEVSGVRYLGIRERRLKGRVGREGVSEVESEDGFGFGREKARVERERRRREDRMVVVVVVVVVVAVFVVVG